MAKKIFLVLLLAALFAVTVFAKDSGKDESNEDKKVLDPLDPTPCENKCASDYNACIKPKKANKQQCTDASNLCSQVCQLAVQTIKSCFQCYQNCESYHKQCREENIISAGACRRNENNCIEICENNFTRTICTVNDVERYVEEDKKDDKKDDDKKNDDKKGGKKDDDKKGGKKGGKKGDKKDDKKLMFW
jgi:hypothetical protein